MSKKYEKYTPEQKVQILKKHREAYFLNLRELSLLYEKLISGSHSADKRKYGLFQS